MNAELFGTQLGVECRQASIDELHDWRQTPASDAMDPDQEFPCLVGRRMVVTRAALMRLLDDNNELIPIDRQEVN